MIFNDDEEIIASTQNGQGTEQEKTQRDRIKLSVKNKATAPLEETKMEVLLELTESTTVSDGVDIVAVLDVSMIMKGMKFNKMKEAMRFLIDKLNGIDRLSVVTFGKSSKRLCPLRCMNDNAQAEIVTMVDKLDPNSRLTSITDGLKTAVRVLDERCHSTMAGRRSAVLIFSSGYQSPGTGDPTNVRVGHLPIFTLGFGKEYDMRVLEAIAKKSIGGTFSNIDVRNTALNDLSVEISPCLERVLPVFVRELVVNIKLIETNVKKVTIKDKYPQQSVEDVGSINLSLGSLYVKDIRKVSMELLLPTVTALKATELLEIVYNYSLDGSTAEQFTSPPTMVRVTRTILFAEPHGQVLDATKSRSVISSNKLWPGRSKPTPRWQNFSYLQLVAGVK